MGNFLALLLSKVGGHEEEAAELFRRALAGFEQGVGPNHPDTAQSMNNLALLLEVKGDYAGAESLLHRAVAICEAALGHNHPTTQKAIISHSTVAMAMRTWTSSSLSDTGQSAPPTKAETQSTAEDDTKTKKKELSAKQRAMLAKLKKKS